MPNPELRRMFGDIKHILGSRLASPHSAIKHWKSLREALEGLLEAEMDPSCRERLSQLASSLESSAGRLAQSLSNMRDGGALRSDWMRFAQYDLLRLKDEALALQEFIAENLREIESARSRAKSGRRREVDLDGLFKELREERAISERTWLLFLSLPAASLQPDERAYEQLSKISGLLLDLREVRRGSYGAREAG